MKSTSASASILLAFACLFLSAGVAQAQLRISEFMASNADTPSGGPPLLDEDGDTSDWIEIQNVSSAPVNLSGWALTDNKNDLDKWEFPSTNLPPGGFMIVFASDKNRRTPGAPLHTNFKLSAEGEYLALVNPSGTVVTAFDPYPGQAAGVSFGFALMSSNVALVPAGAPAHVLVPSVANGGSEIHYTWTGNATNEPFDVQSWTAGSTGVGFNAGAPGDIGLGTQAAMLNQNASVFIRVPFEVDAPSNFAVLTLRMKYDDGFVAWVNGVELARVNAPAEDLSWNSSAVAAHPATSFESMAFGVATNLLRSGTNILAIQGLNLSASDSSFLILPELIGTTLAGDSTSGVYFIQPTPGSENLGGSAALGPGIADVKHTPNVPLDHEDLVVTARVFPTVRPVADVTLTYRVMFNPEQTIPMHDDGLHGDGAAGDGVYGAIIPASASTTGQMVRYRVTARDTSFISSRLPVFSDPAATAEYFGTVVNPNYVTSSIPVIHIFAPPSVLQPGPTTSQTGADSDAGGYVSIFYDGEFYDNVRMWLRGNTTAGYNKKSHRVRFNREHPFRYNSSGDRIRQTSFVADYPDPTYMRQGLSYWLCEETGAAGPFYHPVRLQLNGNFYQLANHNDVHSEELLERLGYDPNGAIYNAVGTIQWPIFSTGGFEKKTRRWDNNADYMELANALSENQSVGQRMTNIFDYLDVPQVISYVVAARLFHENDDVWANMSLYHDNDGDGLWRVIPFDLNLSWGAAFMDTGAFSGLQVTNDDLKSFPMYGSSQAVPSSGPTHFNRLYDAIFQVPQTREMFLRRLRTVLDEYIKPPGTPSESVPVEQKVLAWRDLIAEEAALDRAWWGWPPKGGQCNFDPGIDLDEGVHQLIHGFIAGRRQHLYGKHSITNKALPIGIAKHQNAGIPLAQPTNATIVISGVEFNPASGNQDEEYVRLSNTNTFAVDISGWTLGGAVDFQFRGGTVIPAGGELFVSPNTRAFRQRAVSPRGGEGRFVVGPYTGALNAWGETLILTDAAGRLVTSNVFEGAPSLAQRYLRVTEIMYNPSPLPAVTPDPQQLEYIEVKNISTDTTLNLANVRFTRGIQFNFTGSSVTTLGPQQRVLIVRNTAAFTAKYGAGLPIAGEYSGALNNGGEVLRLDDAAGEKILEFEYNNSWYPTTDGLGFSLVIRDEQAHWSTWGNKDSWRPSSGIQGSPGSDDPPTPTFPPIVVNEVLAHTDAPLRDSIELHNPTAQAVDIGGWFLTDDPLVPKKFRIPPGTQIPAGGYIVFDETHFNVGPNAFRLSELGEGAWLFSGDANTNLTGYWQGEDFPASPNGVSFGRYTNSVGDVHFVLQSSITLNAPNSGPRVGPIVISEIMYHPSEESGDEALAEFIELANITGGEVLLYDAVAPTNTWRLRNAVDFDFPPNHRLNGGERLLVVGFDPADAAKLDAFRALYNVPADVAVYGPWSGRLSNAGETIELKQPGTADTDGTVPYYMIDKVSYGDAAPWPPQADGIGNSLQRLNLSAYGNDPTNWFAGGVTAGRPSVPNAPPVVAITSPGEGAQVPFGEALVVSVSASDTDGSLALVQLLANGVELGRWTASHSNFTWVAALAGWYELTARAVDDLGGIALSEPVRVHVVAPPPVVSIVSPVEGAILPSDTSVMLSASATSGGLPAAGVSFYSDDVLIGSVAYPFQLSWTANPPGYRTIKAVATDSEGRVSEPATVNVFVQQSLVNPVLFPAGAEWKYRDNGIEQPPDWKQPWFPDADWPSGPGRFGFNNGNTGFGTLLSYGPNPGNRYRTYYFRKTFVVPTLVGMTGVRLEVQRDDGVAVYLNGNPVYRNNLPPGELSYSQLATNATDNGATWLSADLPVGVLSNGINVIAAEVHQSSPSSSDLVFDMRLTLLGSATGPAISIQPQSQTVEPGAPFTLFVTAIGSAPLSYQWTLGGTNIPGATQATLMRTASAATAGDYRAIVSNPIGSVTSLVAQVTLASVDSDGDGLPDDWELAHGTDPLQPDADADPDGDGHNNWQEYVAGTHPTDALSVLKLEWSRLSDAEVELRFNAVSNRTYAIQVRPESAGPAGWQTWQSISAASTNRLLRFTNTVSGTSPRFYRLVIPAE
ncbi:MAG TPA: lamin tail domain-containing protein [Verrucomicrobiota bacterium]|nr:lamin tail domain-containing protein [Verrucomicrobiota bacterium]